MTAHSPQRQDPEWDGDFDPERARSLVQGLRLDLLQARSDLADAKTEHEDRRRRLAHLEGQLAMTKRALIIERVLRAHPVLASWGGIEDFLPPEADEVTVMKTTGRLAEFAASTSA